MKIGQVLRRTGCGILLILWFTLLLTPCLAFVLAVQKEIVLTHSDIPEDAFRVWLIQDINARGIGISNSQRVTAATNGATCTIIDGRFLLWQGKAASPHFCSCYTKQNGYWSSIAEGDAACHLAEK
ncbi:MAG: hypothetical protein ABI947_24535 [Chloroflexota bacterium]